MAVYLQHTRFALNVCQGENNISLTGIATSLIIKNAQRPDDCRRSYKFRFKNSTDPDQWSEWKEDKVGKHMIELQKTDIDTMFFQIFRQWVLSR